MDRFPGEAVNQPCTTHLHLEKNPKILLRISIHWTKQIRNLGWLTPSLPAAQGTHFGGGEVADRKVQEK